MCTDLLKVSLITRHFGKDIGFQVFLKYFGSNDCWSLNYTDFIQFIEDHIV